MQKFNELKLNLIQRQDTLEKMICQTQLKQQYGESALLVVKCDEVKNFLRQMCNIRVSTARFEQIDHNLSKRQTSLEQEISQAIAEADYTTAAKLAARYEEIQEIQGLKSVAPVRHLKIVANNK